jgi:hypothetical protein
LLGDAQRVVDLDTKVTDGAFDYPAGATISRRRLRDDVNVLTAIIQRLDAKVIRLLVAGGDRVSCLPAR